MLTKIKDLSARIAFFDTFDFAFFQKFIEGAGGELRGERPTKFCEDIDVARAMLRTARDESEFATAPEFTPANLLKGFFEFYAYTFNRKHHVVSVRKGVAFSKGRGKCKCEWFIICG